MLGRYEKIKEWVGSKVITIKFKRDSFPLKVNFFVAIGIILISMGVFTIRSEIVNRNTYDSIATSERVVSDFIQGDYKSEEGVKTLVFYSNTCPYCKAIEKDLVSRINELRRGGNKDQYLVVNVDNLSDKQLRNVKQKMSAILIENKIPLPLVVNTEKRKNKLKILEKSDTAEMIKIEQVLEKSKEEK